MDNTLQHHIAKASLSIVGAGTIIAWLDVLDVLVRIGAGVIAIISGIYAARYYRRKSRELRIP